MKADSLSKKFAILSGVALAAITLIFTWAVSSAPGGSPDEPAHFVSIYCFSEKYQASCRDAGESIYDLSPVKNISACYLYQRDRGADCEVKDLFDRIYLNSSSVFSPFTENNYYKTLSIFSSDYYILSLLSMRILNGFIFLIIVIVSYLLFPKNLKAYFLFSTLLLSTPLTIYIVTSINTSAWLLIGIIGTWSNLYSLLYDIKKVKFISKLFISRLIFLLFSIYISISSRFDGIYFVLIAIFTVSLIFILPTLTKYFQRYLSPRYVYLFFYPLILIFSLLLIFYFRGRSAVAGSEATFIAEDKIFDNLSRLPHLLLGPFGTWGLGWLDVWLSPITYLLVILAVLGVSFVAFKGVNFSHLTSISILGVSIVLLPLLVLQNSEYSVGEWVQPRYVLPLYFPLFGLLVISLALSKKYLSKLQSGFALCLITIAHSFALFANIERYVRGQNTVSPNLNKDLVWWWDNFISPNTIWILGSISMAILSGFVYKLMNQKSPVGPEGLEPPTPAL